VGSGRGLDRKTRSCITLTELMVRGQLEELALHVGAALRNGLTEEEIRYAPRARQRANSTIFVVHPFCEVHLQNTACNGLDSLWGTFQ
jgi:hypothetical protein